LQNSKITNRLSSNQKKFFAELIGTFVVVVFATGSVVLAVKYSGTFGLWFVALAPAVAVALMVYMFGKISMAHFNPAVTIGFLITKHMPKNLFPLYLGAEIIGASFVVPSLSPGRYAIVSKDSGNNLATSAFTINGQDTCLPPLSGDWNVTSSCTLSSSATAPADVIVQPGAVLTIPSGLTLTINFGAYHLLVEPEGEVFIQPDGKLSS
jgi:hypothetical protein